MDNIDKEQILNFDNPSSSNNLYKKLNYVLKQRLYILSPPIIKYYLSSITTEFDCYKGELRTEEYFNFNRVPENDEIVVNSGDYKLSDPNVLHKAVSDLHFMNLNPDDFRELCQIIHPPVKNLNFNYCKIHADDLKIYRGVISQLFLWRTELLIGPRDSPSKLSPRMFLEFLLNFQNELRYLYANVENCPDNLCEILYNSLQRKHGTVDLHFNQVISSRVDDIIKDPELLSRYLKSHDEKFFLQILFEKNIKLPDETSDFWKHFKRLEDNAEQQQYLYISAPNLTLEFFQLK